MNAAQLVILFGIALILFGPTIVRPRFR